MKCKIQWIDRRGEPTPDNNEAVGLAICLGNMKTDLSLNGHIQAFPICEEHLAQMRDNWIFIEGVIPIEYERGQRFVGQPQIYSTPGRRR